MEVKDLDSKEEIAQKSLDRLDVLEKIAQYEYQGLFDKNVEKDNCSRELLPNQIDYFNKNIFNKIKTKIAYKLAYSFIHKMQKNNMFQLKEIKGIENFKNLQTGAVITSNHYNALDSFVNEFVFDATGFKKKGKKMYRIINEANYTSFEGLFGFIMRHCHTLPLSSNNETMKHFLRATNTYLKNGDFVLIYPEASMWWNYKKPRPFKVGAFRFAVKNNVPVLPIFTTMQDSDVLGPDGFAVQQYTVHIGEPIYADINLNNQQNMKAMSIKNYNWCKQIYEKVYGQKLEFSTEPEIAKKTFENYE